MQLACSNHLLNLHTRNINFLGKLTDSFIGVFIGERVDVNLHSGSDCKGNGGISFADGRLCFLLTVQGGTFRTYSSWSNLSNIHEFKNRVANFAKVF